MTNRGAHARLLVADSDEHEGDDPSGEGRRAPGSKDGSWTVEGGVGRAGDLVRDVVLYRTLRQRLRTRGRLSPTLLGRCLELERRLVQPPTPSDDVAAERKFARFPCQFSARLHLSRPSEPGLAVEVRDFGVGGVKVVNPGVLLDLDELAWFAFDLVGRRGSHNIVFTSRVVWLDDDQIGLVFAGAPRWARRCEWAGQHASTLRDAVARAATSSHPAPS